LHCCDHAHFSGACFGFNAPRVFRVGLDEKRMLRQSCDPQLQRLQRELAF
jgi:hypothetical protein